MAYTWTDITEAGWKVWARADRKVVVGGVPVDVGMNAFFVRALDVGSTVVAIVKGQDGDRAILVNSLGKKVDIGHQVGNHGVALMMKGGLLYALWVNGRDLNIVRVSHTTLETSVPTTLTFPEAPAEGILDIENGHPVFVHERRTVTLAGLAFFYPLRRGDYTVGTTHDNKVIVHRHSTGSNFLAWGGDTKVAPRINSSGIVAVSGEDGGDAASLFVRPEQFTPWTTSIPAPDLVPDPIPVPTPDPGGDVIPDLRNALETARRLYGPTMTNNECVKMLDDVARANPGFGLLHKPNGNNGLQPTTGIPCSVDFLVWRATMQGIDCLGDAGGASKPGWGEPHETFPVERFVPPSVGSAPIPVPDPAPDPDPTPGPEPGQPGDGDVLEAIGGLAELVADIGNEILERLSKLETRVNAVDAGIDVLIPSPTYTGRVFGTTITLKPSTPVED